MAKRVEVRERSLFGEVSEETMQNPGRDMFFLPGYSDKRQELERAWRDYERGLGPKPAPLKGRFQFVAYKERLTGQERTDKIPQWRGMGYRPVKGYAEYEQLTGQKLADEQGRPLYNVFQDAQGNLLVGSQMLMYCDADVAARNLAAARRRAEQLEQGVQARVDQAAANFNSALHLSRDGATGFDIGVIEDDAAEDSPKPRHRR